MSRPSTRSESSTKQTASQPRRPRWWPLFQFIARTVHCHCCDVLRRFMGWAILGCGASGSCQLAAPRCSIQRDIRPTPHPTIGQQVDPRSLADRGDRAGSPQSTARGGGGRSFGRRHTIRHRPERAWGRVVDDPARAVLRRLRASRPPTRAATGLGTGGAGRTDAAGVRDRDPAAVADRRLVPRLDDCGHRHRHRQRPAARGGKAPLRQAHRPGHGRLLRCPQRRRGARRRFHGPPSRRATRRLARGPRRLGGARAGRSTALASSRPAGRRGIARRR